MKKIVPVIALFASLFVSGCAIKQNIDWSATGGSRADGIVKLSYEEKGPVIPILSEDQAIGVANDRCKSWGYLGVAKPFDVVSRSCMSSSFGHCSAWIVSRNFQCTIGDVFNGHRPGKGALKPEKRVQAY